MLVTDLWKTLDDVEMEEDGETIAEQWLHFPAGTWRETIWHWFEYTFNISVAELMYGINIKEE